MGIFSNVICPISNVKINSYVSRLTVFMNAILIVLFLLTGNPLFMWVVAIDYGIRALWNPQFSPLRWGAAQLVEIARLPEKLTDQAPKMFASRVGFLFAAFSVLFFLMSPIIGAIVAGILLVFTILDSVFDFCVGCLTYQYIVLPLFQERGDLPS